MKQQKLPEFLVICLLLYCMPADAPAQSMGEWFGRNAKLDGVILPVAGETSLPANVWVTLLPLDWAERETTSASGGTFSFGGIPEGNYEVIVECAGCGEVRISVPQSSFVNGIAHLTIALGGGLLHRESPPAKLENTIDVRHLAIPDKAIREFQKGSAAYSQSKLDEALTHFRRAVELEPNFVEAFNKLAASQVRMGDLDRAEQSFLKAAKISPDSFAAQKGLGFVCLSSRRWSEAIHYLSAACDLRPNDAESHAYLGGALYEMERYEEAETELKRALALDNLLYQFSYLLGQASLKNGRPRKRFMLLSSFFKPTRGAALWRWRISSPGSSRWPKGKGWMRYLSACHSCGPRRGNSVRANTLTART